MIDILVYIETVLKGRRVFLDFRANPEGMAFGDLSEEALGYLTQSRALLNSPVARLQKMNPGAIALYRDHDIDIAREPLEIAVCVQHNNGGLVANAWWESENTAHLFPVGEVNGSHGAYRPGGAALNAGQVGGIRAAEYIAARYADESLADDLREALRDRQLCFAHVVYLEAVKYAVQSGVGSRGSAMVINAENGTKAHAMLGADWRFEPEDESFRERVLVTDAAPDGSVSNTWIPRRPIPESDLWFETAWAAFREGRIYEQAGTGTVRT
jgi:succinate dehydrogenase/fumarate reductase flavoprotein subunit